jgi:SnoaL-like domain
VSGESGPQRDLELIVGLKDRYVRAIDAKRWPELHELLTEDFVFEGAVDCRGAAAFVKLVTRQLAGAWTEHRVRVSDLAITGVDAAEGSWEFSDLIDQRRCGAGLVRRGFGRYRERYRRVAGEWRIAAMAISRTRIECSLHRLGRDPVRLSCASEAELNEWLRLNGIDRSLTS